MSAPTPPLEEILVMLNSAVGLLHMEPDEDRPDPLGDGIGLVAEAEEALTRHLQRGTGTP